jgi:P27 family predicted phage terminase small subunit
MCELNKAEYLTPIAGMKQSHKDIWYSIVLSMKADYFKECDRGLLEEYIKLKSISDDAWMQVQEEDIATVSDANVVMINKKIDLINKLSSTMATISQKLGIAPSTRNRADIKDQSQTPNASKSKLDALLD